jgi:hypothetical protein
MALAKNLPTLPQSEPFDLDEPALQGFPERSPHAHPVLSWWRREDTERFDDVSFWGVSLHSVFEELEPVESDHDHPGGSVRPGCPTCPIPS